MEKTTLKLQKLREACEYDIEQERSMLKKHVKGVSTKVDRFCFHNQDVYSFDSSRTIMKIIKPIYGVGGLY